MTPRQSWTIGFLGVTFLALLGEFVAGFSPKNGTTIPWTDYIITYVPPQVTFPVILFLMIWVPFHFITKYMHTKWMKNG